MRTHRVVLYDKIGPGPHPCHWCGKPVDWTTNRNGGIGQLVADHVNDDRGDNRPENIVPSCRGCNGQRSHRVEDDESFVVNATGHRIRSVERYCAMCGTRFLVPRSALARGEGRYCSRRCHYDSRSH